MLDNFRNTSLDINNTTGLDAATKRFIAVGQALWLMSRSPLHKHLMVTDIEWLVMPPIMLGQFHSWEKTANPMAFASWAYLSEEAEERIVTNGIRRLMPSDWKSGDRLWLIDFLCPFGGQDLYVKDLKTNVLKNKKVKMLQAGPNGARSVVEW